MKKTILVLASAIFVAACAAPPTNREVGPTANSAAESKPSAALTEADAMAKERQIWDALQKKDYDGFAKMLGNDFVNVVGDGVYDKPGTVKGVTGFVPTDITFSDWKFLPIDKEAGVIIYNIKHKGTSNGEEVPPQSSYCSSAWVNRGGQTLALYHQSTPVTPPQPQPASKSQKDAPTPAASTPAATSADVVANEKAVWAALKAKDYNAFGTFLAPGFIEVEGNAIMDRQASIKGVQAVDLSKSELSDWRIVRVTDGASLVTYTVKTPGLKPDTELDSTLWVNRNGKWLALFHQGTPEIPMPPPKPGATKAGAK